MSVLHFLVEKEKEKQACLKRIKEIEKEASSYIGKNRTDLRKIVPIKGSIYSLIENCDDIFTNDPSRQCKYVKISNNMIKGKITSPRHGFDVVPLIDCVLLDEHFIPIEHTNHYGTRFEQVQIPMNRIGKKINVRQRTSTKTLNGYVYLAHADGTSLYKIGRSKNPEKRLSSLNSGSPIELSLHRRYRTIDPVIAESTLHEEFKDKRKQGEWFELGYRDVDRIDQIMDMQSFLIF